MLEEAGLIENREGRLRAHAAGHPPHRPERPLRPVQASWRTDKMGQHELERTRRRPRAGLRHQAATSSAIRSTSTSSAPCATRSPAQGRGTPVRLSPDDFEVERTEHARAVEHRAHARPVAVDADAGQLPAGQEGRDGAALADLVPSSRATTSGIVGLQRGGPGAHSPSSCPRCRWDFVYGTNMQHAFLLSRRLLARQTGTKQIIMITDGEPTAHIQPGRRRLLQLPAGARRRSRPRCGRSPAAPATASASTRSCSTPPATCRTSSSG